MDVMIERYNRDGNPGGEGAFRLPTASVAQLAREFEGSV